jgi:hypothetical protein
VFRGVILIGALSAILAVPGLAAAAGPGNGVYNPYPAAANPTAAGSYYAKVAHHRAAGKTTSKQLKNGRFLPGLAPNRNTGASQRAGAGGVSTATVAIVAAAVLAALLGVAVGPRLLRRRAASGATAHG